MRGIVVRVLSVGLLLASSASVLASQPGQPLDCSDWVFLEPGFYCIPWINYPCSLGAGSIWCRDFEHHVEFDNQAVAYRIDASSLSDESCNLSLTRYTILKHDGTTEADFAYIDERCSGPYSGDTLIVDETLRFLPTAGQLRIPLKSTCGETLGGQCQYPQQGGPNGWVAAISGFATTFEILHTYTPTASDTSFRVPYLPEGLPAADYFDSYTGDLAMVSDFSQAQPLHCGFPATPPTVGDFLTVADPLPDPDPGRGRYYVTSVTHQGQTRYGRKSMGGVLSGRDPLLLPACQN